jgi:hypothetical protein
MSAKPAHSSDDGENSVRERTSGARAGGRPRLGAAQVLTVDVEAVREAPPVGGAHELEALGEDPEPALHLLRALVALAVPASRGQTATGGERQEGSRGPGAHLMAKRAKRRASRVRPIAATMVDSSVETARSVTERIGLESEKEEDEEATAAVEARVTTARATRRKRRLWAMSPLLGFYGGRERSEMR